MASDFRPASRARSYRQHAHDCITNAVKSDHEEARVALLELAFGWARLARQIEKMEPTSDGIAEILQGVEVLLITSKLQH